MFLHPLINDLTSIKDADLETAVSSLMNKYSAAAKMRNHDMCNQLVLILEDYKAEQARRHVAQAKLAIKNSNKDLGDLVKFS